MKKYIVGYWKLESIELMNLMFANDMAIVADTEHNLQHKMNKINEVN